jgi:hypothetical protein
MGMLTGHFIHPAWDCIVLHCVALGLHWLCIGLHWWYWSALVLHCLALALHWLYWFALVLYCFALAVHWFAFVCIGVALVWTGLSDMFLAFVAPTAQADPSSK